MKWMLIMLLLAVPARAQLVHKCMADGGQVSYQSAPCESGQRTLKQWQAVPEPVASPAGLARSSVTSGASRRKSRGRTSGNTRARAQGVRGSVITAENNGGSPACLAAKRQRQQTLERAGLKRTYALLQQLDNAVWRACN